MRYCRWMVIMAWFPLAVPRSAARHPTWSGPTPACLHSCKADTNRSPTYLAYSARSRQLATHAGAHQIKSSSLCVDGTLRSLMGEQWMNVCSTTHDTTREKLLPPGIYIPYEDELLRQPNPQL